MEVILSPNSGEYFTRTPLREISRITAGMTLCVGLKVDKGVCGQNELFSSEFEVFPGNL